MKRVWVPVVAGVCVIAAIVAVLVIRNSGDKSSDPAAKSPATNTSPSASVSAPTTGSTTGSTTPSSTARPPANAASGTRLPTSGRAPGGNGSGQNGSADGSSQALSTRAGLGLRKYIADHPLSGDAFRSLTSCPLGKVRPRARAIDAAADGTSAGYRIAQAVIQRYRISRPNNGSVGDSGEAISCLGVARGGRQILGLSAATITNPVPRGAITGLNGPQQYRDGETYAKTTDTDLCTVYWVPPRRDYDLVVVFRTEKNPTVSQCRRGFATAAPTMLSNLAALAD